VKKFLALLSVIALALGTALIGTASAHQASTGDPYAHYPDVSETVGITNGMILYAHASGLNESGAVLASALFCNSNGDIQPADGRQCDIADLSGLGPVAAENWARVRVVQGQMVATALSIPADPRAVCPPSAADLLAGDTCGVAFASVTGGLVPVAFGFRGVAFTSLKQIPQVDGGIVQKFKAPTIKITGGTTPVKYQLQNFGGTTINLSGSSDNYTGAANHDPLSPQNNVRGVTFKIERSRRTS
jgi:hypothetical protein